MHTERYIVTADLGSAKLGFCVARVDGANIQIVYYKEAPSQGVRYSCVFHPRRAAACLQTAIKDAEKDLGIRIRRVLVAYPRYGFRQESASAQITRADPDNCITQEEIDMLKETAILSYPLVNQAKEDIYGAVAQSFSIDEDIFLAREDEVVGLTAETLEGHFNVFVGENKPVKNLDLMLNAADLVGGRKLFIPECVAQAVLKDSEAQNGVALIEIGAEVSSVSIYKGRILRHYAAIPFGGRVISTDIMGECGFSEELAENIKLAFGACMPDKLQSMAEKILQINDAESGSYEHLPLKYLSEIITCRAREIVDALLFHIQQSGFAQQLRTGVVLTGGGAGLANLALLIKEMSGYTVRIGYPRRQLFSTVENMGIGEPGAAAAIGMVLEAIKDERLNCVEEEEMQKEMKMNGEEPPARPDNLPLNGKLFSEEEIPPIEPEPKIIKWVKKQAKRVEGSEVGQYLGNIFDGMK